MHGAKLVGNRHCLFLKWQWEQAVPVPYNSQYQDIHDFSDKLRLEGLEISL